MTKTKQHDAFALRDFDAAKFFDFKAWYKKAGDGLTVELRTQVATAFRQVEKFQRRIVRHLMRLLRLKSLMASEITRVDNSALCRIKSQISRADVLTAAYENINHQAIEMKQALNRLLDDIAAVDRIVVKNVFRERLAMLRKEKKISQTKLAAELGLKRSTYTAYEAGANEPTISILVKLCKYFNKPANWFLGL